MTENTSETLENKVKTVSVKSDGSDSHGAPGDRLRAPVSQVVSRWEVIFSYLSNEFDVVFSSQNLVHCCGKLFKSVRQVAKNDLPPESTGIPLERLVLPSGLPVLHENRTRRILWTPFLLCFPTFPTCFRSRKNYPGIIRQVAGNDNPSFSLVDSVGDTMQKYWETQ